MKEPLKKLDDLILSLNKECTLIFKNESNINQIYKSSRYVYSISHRAIEILRAFKLLAEDGNFLVANALTRLQADNCIRLFAMGLVKNRGEFFEQVLSGTHIRNIKDADGKKMLDTYLVDMLSEFFPEFKDKYKYANKFIHFCDLHLLFNTIKDEKLENNQMTTYISDRVEISDNERIKNFEHMCFVTNICYLLIHGYRQHMKEYLNNV